VLPLVCKEWSAVLRHPSPVWEQVILEPSLASGSRLIAELMVDWIRVRGPAIKELRVLLFDFLPSVYRPHPQLYMTSNERRRFGNGLSPPWNRHTHPLAPANSVSHADSLLPPGSLGTTVGPGFLATVLTQHLTHLEQLRIKRSGRIMSNEDLRAVSCLTNLSCLEICNLVLSHTPTCIKCAAHEQFHDACTRTAVAANNSMVLAAQQPHSRRGGCRRAVICWCRRATQAFPA
jgi:hypothetical protein